MPNRLAHATSPYLLQHADNPVDWYEWGEEAFAEARRRDVPIFLSVGYSSCHWCHVMAHESFEDPDTAAAMNAAFVNVKVDREERPDVDAIYMNAVQAMTGRGGWPMSVWLTPDRRPFVAGTYFPAESRHGMRSFREVIAGVSAVWSDRRDEAVGQGDRLTEAIARDLPPGEGSVDDRRLADALASILASADATYGGFGGAPKFPQAPVLDFLLRASARPWGSEAGPHLRRTLDAMAAGGLRDHVGGGFARYCVDRTWEIPHFEKMLYDNALLARVYLRSWQSDGPAHHRDVAVSTIEYVLRDLALEDGGFASAEDADSEGEEGLFYTWTVDEIRSVCGPDAPVAERLWGVTPAGNFEGRNHLRAVASIDDVAEALDMPRDEVRAAAARALDALFAARSTRVRPGLDDKLVVGWNGLMIRTLAEAGAILGEDRYLDTAGETASYILGLIDDDGLLPRTWAQGRRGPTGVLEDHAAMAVALFTLYQATADPVWYEHAATLVDTIRSEFRSDGRLWATPGHLDDLIVRPTDQMDNPSPAGSSLAIEALWTLALYTGDPVLSAEVVAALAEVALLVDRHPSAVGHVLAVATSLTPAREVAVVGEDAMTLSAPVRSRLPMDLVLATSLRGTEPIPLLADRFVDGRTLAYVCRDFACALPVDDPADLLDQLSGSDEF